MGSVSLMKVSLLFFFIISGSLFSASFAAGMTRKLKDSQTERVNLDKDTMPIKFSQSGEEARIHHRNLVVKTNDYPGYEPPPAFDKPPYKLIPN